jgi:hypothetical protein
MFTFRQTTPQRTLPKQISIDPVLVSNPAERVGVSKAKTAGCYFASVRQKTV